MQSSGTYIKDDSLEEMISVKKGTVIFVPAHTEIKVHSLAHGQSCSILVYAATVNDNMFGSCAKFSSGEQAQKMRG